MKSWVLAVVLLSGFTSPVLADSEDSESGFLHWLSGYSLDLGVTIQQTSLTATDPEGNELGILTGKMGYLPFFNLGSPYDRFLESNFGYNFQYGYSSFSLTTQEVDAEDVDTGASAKGNFLYAMPVFF